jgi:hypothetical protein
MKQFHSKEKLGTGIVYALELASSISILLLAFGLIASMANVLTDHIWMQQIWAWTQCIANNASVAATIIRTFRSYHEGEKAKTWLYGLLSVLLIVAHAMRHVEIQKVSAETGQQQPGTLALTPQLVEALRLFLSQTTVFRATAGNARNRGNSHHERSDR